MPTNTDTSQRYASQQRVNKIGLHGQKTLANSHVVIIGLGGLGCPVSTLLCGAGLGKLTLVDDDIVSLSNLHRQTLYNENDIGLSKAVIAEQKLKARNNEIAINSHNKKLSVDNASELLTGADVVVDAADNFITSYTLSDYCFKNRVPLISASVNTTYGHLGVFCGTKLKPAPSLRAVFPQVPSSNQNCNTVGVTGPSANIVGALQAQECLKTLLNSPNQLLGKLMYMNLWDYQQKIIDFNQAKEPTNGIVQLIGNSQLTLNDYIIDVRDASEIDNSRTTNHIAHANIPLSKFKSQMTDLPRDKRIVCFCQSGQRAQQACQILLDSGYSHIAVLN